MISLRKTAADADGASDEQDLKPREYQTELVALALQQNGIIFMPTGSGKTFVASMMIKELGVGRIEKKFTEGGQRTFFLVNTVQLVAQQAAAVERDTPFTVGRYSGDMNVDYWDRPTWYAELDKHNVLVMTAQIFLNLILHGFLQFSQVNLLIMDECHHTTNKHAMKQIMTQFVEYSSGPKPRILGLTATLLNSNIKPNQVSYEIQQLENSLCAKVLTPSNDQLVKKFSTNPMEKFIWYSAFELPTVFRSELDLVSSQIVSLARKASLPERTAVPLHIVADDAKLIQKKKSWVNVLENMLAQIKIVGDELGPYAASKSILALIVRLERLKLSASDSIIHLFLSLVTTKLHYLRKCFDDIMSAVPFGERPIVFASPKLKKLFEIFRESRSKKFSALVFVELRFTAKTLHYVIQDLAEYNSDFKDLSSDFIVGYNNNPLNSVREMTFEKKASSATMEKFNSKITNLLIASSVIEEGTDIAHCNYVVRFDKCKTFRSYVQSKGRARSRESQFFIFCDSDKTEQMYESYRVIEQSLVRVLRCPTDDCSAAWESDPMEPLAPFGPDGPKVTVYSACSLINRYVSQLPADRFAMLSVFWWSKTHRFELHNPNSGKVQAILQLPINSAIKEPIEGLWCRNIADAKRCTALVACRMLYELGELDDNLIPRGAATVTLEDPDIFTLWRTNDVSGHHKPGTRKRVRMYNVRYPTWLTKCKPEPEIQLYLHVFSIEPIFDTSGSPRLKVFKDHLQSPMEFAMLSSKTLPKLPQFPAFMNVGQVNVTVMENCRTVSFPAKKLELLSAFHSFLFTSVVLRVGHKFLFRDEDNGENSYWIVPVIKGPNEVSIDWATMTNHKNIPAATAISAEERAAWNIRGSDYVGKMVVPWYRPGADPNLRYVVTNVREDLTPLSPFPSDNFKNYSDYVCIKYGARVVNNQQPLIEVRALTSRINCVKPRGPAEGSRKRRVMDSDSEETLIPELCTLIEFPTPYMLKAMLLPSLCHRVHQLTVAEEFRLKLVAETGMGQKEPPAKGWRQIKVDDFAIAVEESDAVHSTVGVSDSLSQKMVALEANRECPWQLNEEPTDVERQLNSVDLLSLIHYNKFFSNRDDSLVAREVQGVGRTEKCIQDGLKARLVEPPSGVESESPKKSNGVGGGKTAPSLKFLDIDPMKSRGPEIADLFTVLTSSRANDIVNYERLETLGDSFLKFGVSLWLFVKYPLLDEGKLTQLKGKVVGNRNLYYSGDHLGLGSRMKASDFAPEDWLPPGFALLKPVKHFLMDNKMTPGMFYGITLSPEEVHSGLLSRESIARMEEIIVAAMDSSDGLPLKLQHRSSPFLGTSSVPDKVVADVVEALLGAYLKCCGLRGAFRLCQYMQILPPKLSDLADILDKKPPTALITDSPNQFDSRKLVKVDEIEETLGYHFNDTSFLVQAFSHSSSPHYLTDCYQRLEFLGDAVLDFLITLYIFDACGKLSPGDLTDLRSALVNNITFSCLAVKYGLHKHLICRSYVLTNAIATFAERQADRGHTIGAEVFYLIDESDVNVGEAVDVPKALGDLFEAVIGAIYLDSGKSLDTTWGVVYRLMREEITNFSQNVPINTVRTLYEKFPSPIPKFGKSQTLEDGRVLIPVEVITNCAIDPERKVFVGVGLTKSAAKLAAAKIALRHYTQNR